MGHSEGFLDAQWLAQKILEWKLGEKSPPVDAEFCLVGTRDRVALVSGGIMYFTSAAEDELERREQPSASPGERAKWQMLHARNIQISLQDFPGVLPSPLSWRRAARKGIRSVAESGFLDAAQPPFFWQNWVLPIDEKTTPEELTLQLVCIFYHWKKLEMTTEDLDVFARFLSRVARAQKGFAREAVNYVLMNWVLPEKSTDFRAYGAGVVWGCFRQAHRLLGSDLDSEERKLAARERSGTVQRDGRKDCGDRKVLELAVLSRTDPRRIYEQINAGELKTTKPGRCLKVETDSARKFIRKAQEKWRRQEVMRELEGVGKKRDSIRKRVYRLRKAGLPEGEIIQRLEKELAALTLPDVESEAEMTPGA